LPTEISLASARRIAVAAQGLATPRPTGRVDARHLRRVLDTVGVIQIDSVNVLVRSQELPLFSRLGNHPRTLIPEATERGELYEYWCHAASHLPMSHHPLSRVRMERARMSGDNVWSGVANAAKKNPGLVAEILSRIESTPEGIVAGDVRTRTGPKGQWWDWDQGKAILEWLFWTGQVTARRRSNDFARVYMALHHAIPAQVLKMKAPSPEETRRQLLMLAARSHGVATLTDLADYHNEKPTVLKPALQSLVDEGSLLEVAVEGWKEKAYLHPEAKRPRTVSARALLSPFDSMVWCRPRNERLFDFHYRIEIYTPAAKRRYGYYVLPFLLDDRLVARVDLKADRQRGVLMVPGAFSEAGTDTLHVASELADELTLMAQWLGLGEIEVGRKGDLATPLRKMLHP
jgi:uncharacterized protein YcaQ